MPRKKGVTGKMFALVHWVGTANKDVYPLSSLPATARKLDAECTLDFVPKDRDGKELPAVQSAAKVLRIDKDQSYLKGLIVSPKGVVSEVNGKNLTGSALIEKKQLQIVRQQKQLASLTAQHKLRQEVRDSPSMFSGSRASTATAGAAALQSASAEHLSLMKKPVPARDTNTNKALTDLDSDLDESDDCQVQGTSLSPMFQAFMSQEVTSENIRFVEGLLKAMKTAFKSQTNQEYTSKMDISEFKSAAEDKDPFFPGSACFLPKLVKKNFEEDARGEAEPWQCLVRQVLVHIYGKSLGNYCCNGRKGSRPGLDKTLRQDLLVYAKNFAGDKTVTDEDYVYFVNYLCTNRRSTAKKKISTGGKRKRRDTSSMSSTGPLEGELAADDVTQVSHQLNLSVSSPPGHQGAAQGQPKDIQPAPSGSDPAPPSGKAALEPAPTRPGEHHDFSQRALPHPGQGGADAAQHQETSVASMWTQHHGPLRALPLPRSPGLGVARQEQQVHQLIQPGQVARGPHHQQQQQVPEHVQLGLTPPGPHHHQQQQQVAQQVQHGQAPPGPQHQQLPYHQGLQSSTGGYHHHPPPDAYSYSRHGPPQFHLSQYYADGMASSPSPSLTVTLKVERLLGSERDSASPSSSRN